MDGGRGEPCAIGARADRRAEWAALAVIVAWALAARWPGLVGPFGEGWQHVGAMYALQARNLLRYGPLATMGAGVLNAEVAAPDDWIWYVHHPPGHLWSMAASSVLCGTTAFAAKLPGVMAALLQVVVIHRLVASVLSVRAGLAAALMTAALPAGAYFSTHGSELGPLTMAAGLLALLLDERARARAPDRPAMAGVVAALAVSCLAAWVGVVFAGVIALRDLSGRRFRRALVVAAPAVLVALVVMAQNGWVEWRYGDALQGGSLLESFEGHGMDGLLRANIDVGFALKKLRGHARFDFTTAGAIAAALGLIGLFVLHWRRTVESRAAGWLALRLAAVALGYTVPLLQATLMHRYWLLVALPLVALLVGTAVHLAAVGRVRGIATAMLLLAIAGSATLKVWRAHANDETAWYEEAGRFVREQTPPDAQVFTVEHGSSCLGFYAQRSVNGGVSDALVPDGPPGDEPLLPSAHPWFLIALPPVMPPADPWAGVAAWLDRWFVPRIAVLDGGRHETRLYDLSERAR